ncbi:MAG: hypothetical protein GX303_04115 [Clostridiales bacterium]|nr:hypothetical protein [Clostridiales bacterium]
MKRYLFLLMIAIILLSVFGCSSNAPTDEEIAVLVEERVKASQELNEIYFGDGLPVDILRASVGHYQYVSKKSPYQSIDQIKKATQEVFSSEYSNLLFSNAFSGTNEQGVGIVYARYTEKDNELMMYSQFEAILTGTRTYHFDTIKVLKKNGKRIIVEVDTEDDSGTELVVRLKLVNENGKWLLDTPTY